VGALRLGTGRVALSADDTLWVHEAMARMDLWTGAYELSEHALLRISIQCHYMWC